MNYIHKLQDQLSEEQAERVGYWSGLIELKTYLQSDKFSKDTTVQVSDVLRRIEEIESTALFLRTVRENLNFQKRKENGK